MATHRLSLRRAAVLASIVFTVSLPASAHAQIGACAGQSIAQVFLPWADPGWYASVPDGGLEAGGAGWALAAGATIVSDNEQYYVRSRSDARALALRPAASASTPAVCVGPGHPTLRFFVRGQNADQAALTVSVQFLDPTGASRSVPIGAVTASSTWQPSPALPVMTNTLALLTPQRAVFHFTPAGGGQWYVDDVYVDPYGKG